MSTVEAENSTRVESLWKRSEVARFFGIHDRTLGVWIKRGQLPRPALQVGKMSYWRPDDIRGMLSPKPEA
jgi:predicted site-specific integrase-resolvase